MTKELIDQILRDIGLESIEPDHEVENHESHVQHGRREKQFSLGGDTVGL